jgi:histidyl-tRNA synthetase
LKLTRLRGFQDYLGADARALSLVEETARAIAYRHALNEIRIPTLERIELYERSSGETSDVVQKQLYRVPRAAESAAGEGDQALRPEGTPGVIRAYIDAGLDRSDPEQRFFYCGSMFRYERPQKGRLRQFNQFGVEIFGRADAACDAELIIMIDEFRRALGLDVRFEVNSLGDGQCRPAFRAALLEWGRAHYVELCDDCHQRLERNPLRLLDCKTDAELAKSAPRSLDYLCEPCRTHFGAVERLIGIAGVPYEVNPRLVRGLDYYSRTTFEVTSSAVGSQSAIVAGGRYDGLVEALGGAAIPGTGFAIGVERTALALAPERYGAGGAPDVAIIAIGASAVDHAIELARELRASGRRVELLSPERGVKALLKRADKLGARYALIIGEDEIRTGVVQVKDLRTGVQTAVPRASVAAAVTSGAD